MAIAISNFAATVCRLPKLSASEEGRSGGLIKGRNQVSEEGDRSEGNIASLSASRAILSASLGEGGSGPPAAVGDRGLRLGP